MDAAQAAESVDLEDREWDSAGGSVSGGDSEDDSQGVKAKMGSRSKRRRVVQLDPPQTKDDPLRAAISSRMSARPNWQRQGGFASLMQEIAPGMNASDAPTVDELLLVAEGSVGFLFGTSRAALLQISSPLSTSESKAWLSAQNVDAKLAKVGRSMPQALKNTLYFYSFQKPCEELLRKATVDPAEAAGWAYYSTGICQMPRTIASRRRSLLQCRHRRTCLCSSWTQRSQSQTVARHRRCPLASQ